MSIYKQRFEAEMSSLRTRAIEEIDRFTSESSELLKAYRDELSIVKNEFEKLSGYEKNCKEKSDAVSQIQQNITILFDEIKKARNEIYVDPSDDEYSLLNDIIDSQDKINKIYEKVVNYNKELFGYKKKILTLINLQQYNSIKSPEEKEEVEGKYYQISYDHIPGEKDKLDQLISTYKQFLQEDEQNIKIREQHNEEKIKALLSKIENLLPGATAAGLSSSYNDAENSANWGIWLWILCFVSSISASLFVGWWLFDKGIIAFDAKTSFTGAIIQFMRVFCFEFPLVWLAWTANIKISQYIRLTEEYRHKWTMMRIFDAMRTILNENDSDNAMNTKDGFYNSLLLSFSENPSKCLDKKYDAESPLNTLMKFIRRDKEVKDMPSESDKES